eukprot:366489-Chlamydomonas_euryale.AAC.4
MRAHGSGNRARSRPPLRALLTRRLPTQPPKKGANTSVSCFGDANGIPRGSRVVARIASNLVGLQVAPKMRMGEAQGGLDQPNLAVQ